MTGQRLLKAAADINLEYTIPVPVPIPISHIRPNIHWLLRIMTLDKQLHNARIVSSVAATVISLACGTNVSLPAYTPAVQLVIVVPILII